MLKRKILKQPIYLKLFKSNSNKFYAILIFKLKKMLCLFLNIIEFLKFSKKLFVAGMSHEFEQISKSKFKI